jgi:catalase
VNYYPSKVDKKDKPAAASDVTVTRQPISGTLVRSDYPKEQDEFRQAGERYRTFDKDR